MGIYPILITPLIYVRIKGGIGFKNFLLRAKKCSDWDITQ